MKRASRSIMSSSQPPKPGGSTKLLAFDIEATGLNADFGIVLCVGFKEPGSRRRTEVLSIADYDEPDPIKAEKLLLIDVSARLLEADCWIAHFGRWYDTVFINSRLLYHRLPLLPPNFPLIDTWRTMKSQMKLRNNRLKTLQEFLKLKNEKNAILPEQWIRAMAGCRRSIGYIVEHCRRDIEVLCEAYELLKPLIVDHPFKSLASKHGQCPICSETKLQKRGIHRTRTRAYQRFQCQGCGSWSKSTAPIAKLQVAA